MRGRIDSFAVFGPAETALVVHSDEVVLAFFWGEVAHALAIEARTRADIEVNGSPFSFVEPVKEVFVGGGGFPDGMVEQEVGAVAVALVDHFEEVLEGHGSWVGGFDGGVLLTRALLVFISLEFDLFLYFVAQSFLRVGR